MKLELYVPSLTRSVAGILSILILLTSLEGRTQSSIPPKVRLGNPEDGLTMARRLRDAACEKAGIEPCRVSLNPEPKEDELFIDPNEVLSPSSYPELANGKCLKDSTNDSAVEFEAKKPETLDEAYSLLKSAQEKCKTTDSASAQVIELQRQASRIKVQEVLREDFVHYFSEPLYAEVRNLIEVKGRTQPGNPDMNKRNIQNLSTEFLNYVNFWKGDTFYKVSNLEAGAGNIPSKQNTEVLLKDKKVKGTALLQSARIAATRIRETALIKEQICEKNPNLWGQIYAEAESSGVFNSWKQNNQPYVDLLATLKKVHDDAKVHLEQNLKESSDSSLFSWLGRVTQFHETETKFLTLFTNHILNDCGQSQALFAEVDGAIPSTTVAREASSTAPGTDTTAPPAPSGNSPSVAAGTPPTNAQPPEKGGHTSSYQDDPEFNDQLDRYRERNDRKAAREERRRQRDREMRGEGGGGGGGGGGDSGGGMAEMMIPLLGGAMVGMQGMAALSALKDDDEDSEKPEEEGTWDTFMRMMELQEQSRLQREVAAEGLRQKRQEFALQCMGMGGKFNEMLEVCEPLPERDRPINCVPDSVFYMRLSQTQCPENYKFKIYPGYQASPGFPSYGQQPPWMGQPNGQFTMPTPGTVMYPGYTCYDRTNPYQQWGACVPIEEVAPTEQLPSNTETLVVANNVVTANGAGNASGGGLPGNPASSTGRPIFNLNDPNCSACSQAGVTWPSEKCPQSCNISGSTTTSPGTGTVNPTTPSNPQCQSQGTPLCQLDGSPPPGCPGPCIGDGAGGTTTAGGQTPAAGQGIQNPSIQNTVIVR